MYKVKSAPEYNYCAKEVKCGAVYPLSMTQGYQSGNIYADGTSVLFHHDCGFAFLCGEMKGTILSDVYSLMKNSDRRFILFSEQEDINQFFKKKPDIKISTRYFYTYKKQCLLDEKTTYSVKRIDGKLIDQLNGAITPLFSWSADGFFKNGFGYAVMLGDFPASWAFSAAVSNEEVDIGVETAEKYRGKGLAKAAVNEMIKTIISSGKRPVWACHSGNIGSQRLAESVGFVRASQCAAIMKKHE